ncbi:hypothetical protein [Labedaea rhizosphaerae]|uniref:hypothetical protein n=1 Tax=Labedaea rhizosphaerae TaxID=598644 RepID=UPI00105F96A2|nr:hypothetical protein [Labedaea rhizosphaerae]
MALFISILSLGVSALSLLFAYFSFRRNGPSVFGALKLGFFIGTPDEMNHGVQWHFPQIGQTIAPSFELHIVNRGRQPIDIINVAIRFAGDGHPGSFEDDGEPTYRLEGGSTLTRAYPLYYHRINNSPMYGLFYAQIWFGDGKTRRAAGLVNIDREAIDAAYLRVIERLRASGELR